MSENDETTTATRTKVGRRGLLGILGAVGAGFAAKKLAEPEQAGAADPNDVVKNTTNLVTSATELQGAAGSFGSSAGFEVTMVQTTNSVDAIVGRGGGTNGSGVKGLGSGAGAGVEGIGGNSSAHGGLFTGGLPNGRGVFANGTGTGSAIIGFGGGSNGEGGYLVGGDPNGFGVRAFGRGSGTGLHGEGGTASGKGGHFIGGGPNGVGLIAEGTGTASGINASSSAPHTVFGDRAAVRAANTSDGPAVVGISNNGIGIFGYNIGSGDGDPAACGGFFTTLANNTNAMVSQVFNNVTNAAAFVGSATPGGGEAGGLLLRRHPVLRDGVP